MTNSQSQQTSSRKSITGGSAGKALSFTPARANGKNQTSVVTANSNAAKKQRRSESSNETIVPTSVTKQSDQRKPREMYFHLYFSNRLTCSKYCFFLHTISLSIDCI